MATSSRNLYTSDCKNGSTHACRISHVATPVGCSGSPDSKVTASVVPALIAIVAASNSGFECGARLTIQRVLGFQQCSMHQFFHCCRGLICDDVPWAGGAGGRAARCVFSAFFSLNLVFFVKCVKIAVKVQLHQVISALSVGY